MNTDANKTRLRIKIKRWHGVAKWTWGVGDDEDDVCIVCQSAFEGVAPGVKYPGDECPVVVSAIFFVGRFVRERIYVDSALEICRADANHVHLIPPNNSGESVDMLFICSVYRHGFKVKTAPRLVQHAGRNGNMEQ
ncbi:hypothetical protein ACHAW5_008518 [Stephanodiscus triporus]|uniref:Anaphase-promoting complex subunit 11 RING-H2 finger domain-containing protein n=1 Tax=Stephanodiscus triporus TaxID=2934178 RepID=A0ABD3N912_9STRA